jgi:tetratricopeptide (TPR) repeat protein
LAEQIEKLLPRHGAATNLAWPTAAECAARLGRTDRDLQSALVSILDRLLKPPFATQINHGEQIQRFNRKARELAATHASIADALRVAQAAIAAYPEDAQLYQQLASLERAAGRQAEAETAARRIVDLFPSSAEGWSNLGFTFVQEQKYDAAIKAYQRAFDLNQQDVEPLQNLATALVKLGRTDEAVREFRRAVAISPRFGIAWVGLGEALEGMGRKEEAADCFQKGLENRIYTAPELASLARFCKNRGWLQAASTNYSDAITLDPTDPALPFEAGETLAALGRHREAVERYREAVESSPAWGQAHFSYGIELGKCDQIALATHELQEAARLMPDMLEARLNYGLALAKQGQWNEAKSEFDQVLARSPTNALALHYLDLLRKQNQNVESRK